jgi:hypothetical protein
MYPVMGRVHGAVGNAYLEETVSPSYPGFKIVYGHDIQPGLLANESQEVPDGLYSLAGLTADLYGYVDTHLVDPSNNRVTVVHTLIMFWLKTALQSFYNMDRDRI